MTGGNSGPVGPAVAGAPSVGEPPERYARLAFEGHWNPHAIDLETDAGAVLDVDRRSFTRLRGLLAQFGAGEQRVTESLAPLAFVLKGAGEQRFVATHLYDEARHASFFERYWESVVRPAETDRGLTPSSPTDDRWSSEAYRELFDRTADAMNALIDRDGATTRARAYCHYHLAVEGILADAAYRWIERRYGADTDATAALPGLVDGIRKVRRDEGRHVAFGLTRVERLIERGAVEEAVVIETLDDLASLIRRIVDSMTEGVPEARSRLLDRVGAARRERLEQVGAIDGPDRRP